MHYLVFLLYVLTIVHTFDQAQRRGEESRAQTFTWFSSTLLFYLCDRSAMYLNQRYQATAVLSTLVTDSVSCTSNKGDRRRGDRRLSSSFASLPTSKILNVKLKRPALFQFRPGEFAKLRIPEIDSTWHPFFMASKPGAKYLEFLIQVCDENPSSWTCKLCRLLDAKENQSSRSGQHVFDKEEDLRVTRLEVDIMGPYGTSLADSQRYSHVVAVGAEAGMSMCTSP